MNAVIFNQIKTFTLHGFSKVHDQNKPYSATIFELLDQVWEEVRNKKLSHTGISIVSDNHIFEFDHPTSSE
jgi:hypothetical protein